MPCLEPAAEVNNAPEAIDITVPNTDTEDRPSPVPNPVPAQAAQLVNAPGVVPSGRANTSKRRQHTSSPIRRSQRNLRRRL
ncbi:uncharacterized protein N7515_009518 [Penicillium bovifimosum]|uniref:Uncharacterized protein n=1 Tax=Penicillium bovifimosum TaxID=126998 RepID=A0A9W9GKR0_9EURO|nr:uncharacterized protein N7515_009518 [Penicillium bovifimosum]KAJ5121557.1 hypothetical protein N7515_009518 [Penicillium bovifimosum]